MVFSTMGDSLLRSDLVTGSSITSAYAKVALWQSAMGVLHEKSIAACNAAIAACKQQWRQAVLCLSTARSLQLLPSLITSSSTAKACERCSQWHLLLGDFGAMDISSCSLALSACERAQDLLKARQLLRSLTQLALASPELKVS